MSHSARDAPALTARQAAALAASGVSVGLSAGAGCGKTWVLTERFLAHLDGPSRRPLGRLVALTFTEKAARELRDRVRRACRARLDGGSADAPHWRAILRGLEAAPIGTFHAFCARILRRFAVIAGIDPGFAILEETVAPNLRDEALAACLRDWLAARHPDLTALAVAYGLFPIRQALAELISHSAASEISAWVGRDPEAIVQIWTERWHKEVRPALLRAFADAARPCLDLLAAHHCSHPKMAERRQFLLEHLPLVAQHAHPAALLDQIREHARVQGGGHKTHWPSEAVYEAIKAGLTTVRDRASDLRNQLDFDDSLTREAAVLGLRFARLAAEALAAHDRLKHARGVLDYDDLQVKTRDLLRQHAETVRDELARSLDVLLIDEFQDTDPIQGEILERLAGAEFGAGRLFLVGDLKQSIYRFRGARPRIFQEFRARFPAAGQLALTENFRAVAGLIDFVNALFADTFPDPEHRLEPSPATPARDKQAAVEFLWPTAPSEDGAKFTVDQLRQVEARWIARRLAQRLRDGWTVRDLKTKEPRPAHPGDLVLLFRTLNDAAAYEQALVAEGFDYYVVGGAAFFAQQEVHDLINILSAIEDPLEAVSLAGALRSPFFALSDTGLYWLSTHRDGLVAGLEDCERFQELLSATDFDRALRARDLLTRWRRAKDHLPIAALVDRVLDESGYEAALMGEPLGPRKRANVRKLVRMARRFDQEGGWTLADFVARLRADRRKPPREEQAATTDEEGPVIRLMTIHQAKGLEFPIVVLPDLDRRPQGRFPLVAFDPELGPIVRPPRDSGPSDDEEDDAAQASAPRSLGLLVHQTLEQREETEEALRLFYVATTRARDHLILSAPLAPEARPKSPALKLLDRRFDRQTGHCRVELPEGVNPPAILVTTTLPSSSASPPPRRQRPRLLKVARFIASPPRPPGGVSPPVRPMPRPRLIDLDPAGVLPPVAARVDRLIRAILADPRGLDPAALPEVAARAARAQSPMAPRTILDQALERLGPWLTSALAREIACAHERRGALPWSLAWPEGVSEPTILLGRIDFLFRGRRGAWQLVAIAGEDAMGPRERLRLLLSARVAESLIDRSLGQGLIVSLGSEGRVVTVDSFDPSEIDAALEAVLADA
jgi:ATP-dependent helicase/nuclease subunit A